MKPPSTREILASIEDPAIVGLKNFGLLPGDFARRAPNIELRTKHIARRVSLVPVYSSKCRATWAPGTAGNRAPALFL